MNCKDVDRALDSTGLSSPIPRELEDHLTTCARCRELVGALGRPVTESAPSLTTLRQIERRLVAELRPVNPIAPRRYFFASLILIFVCAVAFGVYRIGAFALAAMSPVQAGGILGVLAISTAMLAYSLVDQMVPGSRHRIPPGLLPLGITISLAVAIAILFPFHHELHFWARNWRCIRAGSPLGALAAVPVWLVLRRGEILSPGMTGAAAGLFAGLVGTTALEIHCPNLDASHILVSHLGLAVTGALSGLFLGLASERSKTMWRRP